jgi:phosphoserine phosphatase
MTEDSGGTGLDPEALEKILDITRSLAAPFDLPAMLARVIDAGREVLAADRGTVFLYDSAADELYVKSATGLESARFPADRGIAGECARTKRVVNVADAYADPRFNPEIDRKTGYRTRCLLTVPLVGFDDSLVGVLQLLNKVDGVFTDADARIATALGAQCAVALQRARMLEERVAREKMERELAIARDVQMRALPQEMPQVPGYDIAGFSRPANETGGDTYDVVPLASDRLCLLLGDATGHGIGPALCATQMRGMLRMAMRLDADLDATFKQINEQLCSDMLDNRFVTAFLGILDTRRHEVAYHSGGQGPLLHFHASDGRLEWLGTTTPPLGLFTGLPLGPQGRLHLEPGDVLALLTDGIYERADGEDRCFGEERVGALVREHSRESASRLVEIVLEGAEQFAGGVAQQDDVTLLVLKRLPG